jgi:Wiskott-Aldrich syndrome protein
VDSDGDEVTLSSEEELRDFYNSNVDNAIQGNQLIRFRVTQLGSIRDTDNFMESPPQSSTRNTFGRPTPFVFVDHDHLPFNDIFISSPLDREMDSPHAFVEVVDDDMDKENEFSSEMDHPSSEVKGKARELPPSISDNLSSSESVIANETPKKPPIHVQVHGLRPMDSGTFGPPATSTPAREARTPTRVRPVPPSDGPGEETQRGIPGDFPDPPTPELDAPTDPNISLSNDLASLLDSLNSMFLEHPEVGHHLRNLFRNVGNGAYWDSQRGSMARVAEDIQRVARDAQSAVATGAQEMTRNVRQRAQQEAARRVTEAVGNILRVFGAGGTGPSPFDPNSTGSTQVPHYHQTPASDRSGAFPPSFTHPPPVNPTSLQPPPPGMTPSQPGMAPPIGIVPPIVTAGAHVWNQFKPYPVSSPDLQSAGPRSAATHPPDVSYYTASTNRGAQATTSELKTSLEAAKAAYKAEKERYRQEQENRRREKRLAKESATNR